MKNSHIIKQSDNHNNFMHRPIRVMHIVDKLSVSGSGIHGVTRVIERWITHFDPQQFQFCVCSLRSPEASGEIFEKRGIHIYFLSKGKFDPTTLISLLKLIKQEKPNILHLHGYGSTNFGRLASWLTGVPNIVHEHAILPNQPLYQTIVDALLSSLTTKAIAVSNPVREFMLSTRKIQLQKLETIIIGLPLAEFQTPNLGKVEKIRQELGISLTEKVIVALGRLDTVKGQIYLLRAAISILKKLPRSRFLIVGDGPDMLMLQAYAKKEGIEKQVIFVGFQQDISVFFALADVVAIPSLNEGGPLTLFEAMIFRKPVVGTTVGLMPEVIREGETGFLVPCKNPDLLAKKITDILINPNLAQSMGEKAWKVCQNYDISKSVERLTEIYQELVY